MRYLCTWAQWSSIFIHRLIILLLIDSLIIHIQLLHSLLCPFAIEMSHQLILRKVPLNFLHVSYSLMAPAPNSWLGAWNFSCFMFCFFRDECFNVFISPHHFPSCDFLDMPCVLCNIQNLIIMCKITLLFVQRTQAFMNSLKSTGSLQPEELLHKPMALPWYDF